MKKNCIHSAFMLLLIGLFSIQIQAQILVTSLADSGPGTLRQAIMTANTNAGPDVINFAVSGTINILSPLPALNDLIGGTTIDGYSAPGAAANTQPMGLPSNAILQIVVNGNALDAFTITSRGNVIKGLVIQNSNRAVLIDGTAGIVDYNQVVGCYIGTDPTGNLSAPNTTGIEINNGAGAFGASNLIGNGTPAGRNVISGNNGTAVLISDPGSDGNVVVGNFIGTNVNGSTILSNGGSGVVVQNGAAFNIIGNQVTLTSAAERNVISGNGFYGVVIVGPGTNSNAIIGNFVGTDALGVFALGNFRTGIRIADGARTNTVGSYNNNAYGNLISGNGNFGPPWDGVAILDTGTTSNTVEANYIGVDISGSLPLGNGYNGVSVFRGAHHNNIGGLFRNIISGNLHDGIWLDGFNGGANNNNVSNNYIGLDVSGTFAIPNGILTDPTSGHGVRIDGGAFSNQIGPTSISPNYISGNLSDGILIQGPGTNSNVIQYCRIGVDISNNPLPNGGNGIYIGNNAQLNQIGGTGVFQQNGISNNTGHGILIDNAQNNTVIGAPGSPTGQNTISNNGLDGIAVTNAGSFGNTFTQNSIFSNGGLGIDLANDGVTLNDPLDPDVGPNTLLNFPVITTATYVPPFPIWGGNVISGTVDITNPQLATIEVYSVGTNPDPSGYGEGDTYLGSTTPDAAGNWTLSITASGIQPIANLGDQVTALTIDNLGNTSEFGALMGLFLDVNVDPNAFVQNEVSMAIVPDFVNPLFPPLALLAAYNDHPYYGGPGIGVSNSLNGGASWTAQQLAIPNNPFAPPNTPFDRVFDPSATADINGDLYVVHIADEQVIPPTTGPASGIYVHQSTNFGLTWNPPVQIDADPFTILASDPNYRFNDRCQIAADIDPLGQSGFPGALYVVWIKDRGYNMPAPLSDIYFSSSFNGGATWTLPATILNAVGNMGNMPTIAVASDGTIYVCWVDYNVITGGLGTIYLNVSNDGGANWLPVEHLVLANYPLPPINVNTGTGTLDALAKGAAVVEVAPNNPQQVYVVYAAQPIPQTNPPDDGDIFFIRSTAGGATGTWSPLPLQLNTDGTVNDQILPWIDVKPNGIIDVAWYDRRNDVNDVNWDVYLTASIDGGVSFFPEVPVNTIPASPTPIPSNPWMGEYLGLVSDYNNAYIGFTSSFTDINGDVYFNSLQNPMLPMDYGDALDPPYPTFRFNDGARHHVGGFLPIMPWLGNQGDFPDTEPDGQPDPMAMGDDFVFSDDENGVTIPVMFPGIPATITFEVFNDTAWVDGWIDFNDNGIWGDIPAEYIVTGYFPNAIHNVNVNVPIIPAAPAPLGTYARFRINSFWPLQPTGFAFDGEVEDYIVQIDPVMWVGGVDSLWSNPNNWNCGVVPDSTIDVTIPASVTYNPVVTGTFHCHHLLIQDGAKLTVDPGGDLTIHGDMTVGQGTSGMFIMRGGVTTVQGNTTSNPGALIDIKAGTFNT